MPATPSNDDLFHTLAAHARGMTDGRLVLVVLVGLATALGLAVWQPPAWPLVGSLAFGACAVVVALFSLLGVVLGTWIS